ncbi:hypothetical protein DFH29DRAFT_998930 [Suillus ampliporus]|nr:hypothetical protein DFH29DRAFT_998930 [Suillus ampliporus]
MEPHSTHFPALHLRRDHPPFPLNHNLHPLRNIHPRNLKLYTLYYALDPWTPLYAMTGPIRSSTSGKARAKEIQPPRPPNAWILYRSDKLRSLPPELPGGQRRAQADVSKLISEMWRSESEAVKLEYERLADAKKAEHQRLYPTYRFQPMKKEEKERLKEERRQEKEHARAQKKGRSRTNAVAGPSEEPQPPMPPMAYAAPYLLPGGMPPPMHMHQPPYMMFHPEVQFGPAGPSPPLSAASSPDDTSASESPSGSDEILLRPEATHSARASPMPDSQSQSSQEQPSGFILPHSFLQSFPPQNAYGSQPMLVEQPQTAQAQWQSPQDHILPQPSGLGAAQQSVPEWIDFGSSQDSFDFSQPQELLNLDIPFGNNLGTLNDLTFEGLQAMLSCTGENGVFSLDNINPSDLMAHPQGELEIAMAPQPDAQSLELADFYADFDINAALVAATQHNDAAVDPLDTGNSFNDLASLFHTPNNAELQTYAAVQQRQPSLFTRDVLQYIDFEAAEGGLQDTPASQVRPPSPPQSFQTPIFTQMTNTPAVAQSGYVPPAGAVHSSTRRVAASWKPSFAIPDDSPVDHVQTPWNVSTLQ